ILTPLPYPDVARLVFVWQRFPPLPDPPFGRIPVTRGNYEEWKRQNTIFEDMAALHQDSLEETGIDHPRHVTTAFVSANLFSMLGAKPRLGRLFTPQEELKDNDRLAILSDPPFQ